MPMRIPLRRCAALGAAVLLVLAGCTQASGEGGDAVAEDRAALLELSERLANAQDHAYTAEYRLEDTGKSVTVAVDPEAGDAMVLVEDRSEFWSGEDAEELSQWLSVKLAAHLPSGADVSDWLGATAEDPTATAKFSDTTLAGELADCVDVSGAANSPVGAFNVCVTTVGVVASVSAKVGEVVYTAKLVNYHDGVDGVWLDELAGHGKHSGG